ncbi:hypothetical protein FDECE_4025, partial [Fusarium decemcellulare]
MRPSFAVLRHLLLFAGLAGTSRGLLGVQDDRLVLSINNEYSGVCYTYVSVYPVLADDGPEYITVTRSYKGSVTALHTVPPQGDEPGIVIIQKPGGSSTPENIIIPPSDGDSYVIIVRPHTGPEPITVPITRVIPPTGTNPGQLIIETPVRDATRVEALQPLTLEPHDTTGYVTVLEPFSNSALTSFERITFSPSGTARGSVVIHVPSNTLTRGKLEGITLEPAQQGGYVTIIEAADASVTDTTPIRITIQPIDGNPGTVIIQTPAVASLAPLAHIEGQTITLQPEDATGYVTIIEPATGDVAPTAPIRITIPPTGTRPGTVIIQTPPGPNGEVQGGPKATSPPGATAPPTGAGDSSVSYTTI